MYGDEELLALSGLQHFSFCERQWALIHLEQIWSSSGDTARGDAFHARVDTAGYACSHGVHAERSPRIVSYRLGLYGVADIVEYRDGDIGFVTPVEYKVGRPKVEDWDRLQVAAQALCLEEMEGVEITRGAIFYGETRRREQVDITDELRNRVEQLSEAMHTLFFRESTPKPSYSAKCRRCSLLDDCAPQLSSVSVSGYWREVGKIEGFE